MFEIDSIDSPLTAAFAHEIKNPAAVALAHVNLMRTEANAYCLTHLNHIQQALYDICDLVQEMLLAVYTRGDPIEIDFQQMLAEMLEQYRAAWPGISFSLEAEAPLICCARESSLRMIFSNLLKNAVEAVCAAKSPAFPGRIIIRSFFSDDCLNITICDNGVFVSHKPHGNGLGLAICHHLAMQLSGQIALHYREEGGCIATVSLPCI